MALTIGSRLGHYEVTALIGEGGMGQVYQATDTKLKRQVALKILPEAFSADPERLARFQREAEVLASLNHPNIAAIHGLEEADGVRALVLELVEGPTLADRIKRGPIPLDEALPIAKQIAEALEAAHEAGVIHRDLKPANIKVRDDGTVKVLDFGLAKALDPNPEGDPSQSPTLTAAATQMGVIMGTAAYMSPEQASGKPVDKRGDIWSFGVVLFEMLTGQRLFTGETVSHVLGAVLQVEPQWDALPRRTAHSLGPLLRRCLEKDRRRRFRDIGDVAYELQRVLEDPGDLNLRKPVEDVKRRLAILPWALATGCALAAIVLGALLARVNQPVLTRPVRFSVTVSIDERVVEGAGLALSNNGRRLAYVSRRDGIDQLCVRPLAEWESRCIPEAEGVGYVFFSPDGRRVGFPTRSGSLKVVDLDTELITQVADVASSLGGAWHPDGNSIIFNRTYNEGLWRVPSAGGTPTVLTTPDSENELGHFWPQVLPDGNTVIFTRYAAPLEESQIAALHLDSGEISPLKEGVVFGRYVDTGHLLFVRLDTLIAAPFDLERLEITGAEQPVQEDVFFDIGDVQSDFAVSRNGTLAYIPSASLRELVWVDLDGNEEKVSERRDSFLYPSLSPDGREIAYQRDPGIPQIWRYSIERDNPELLVSGDSTRLDPLWTPDGHHIVYQSEKVVWDLHWQSRQDRTEEVLLETSDDKFPTSFSPDSRLLVYSEPSPDTGMDLWILSIEDRQPEPFLQTPFSETNGVVSPRGELIAYQSDREGRSEIYVQPFPLPGTDYTKVSIDGGEDPRWSRDGRTLFYRSADNMMAVRFDNNSDPGAPEVLFPDVYEGPVRGRASYDTAPDGRLLMVKTPPELLPRQVNVVVNWFEELKRLVPTDQ